MAPTPSWVKDLKPAGPQGTELLSQERAKSNVNVKALSTFLHTQEGIDRKRTILKMDALIGSRRRWREQRDSDSCRSSTAGPTRTSRLPMSSSVSLVHMACTRACSWYVCVLRSRGFRQLANQLYRSPYVTRARPSSTRSSSSPRETTSTLAVTPRPSSATAPTYEVSRRRRPGAPRTRRSSSTRPP
jgi:hypothetical protein